MIQQIVATQHVRRCVGVSGMLLSFVTTLRSPNEDFGRLNCTDLLEKAQWCVDHFQEALQIAERAYQKSCEMLTRLACFRQWDRVIAQWRSSSATVQSANARSEPDDRSIGS